MVREYSCPSCAGNLSLIEGKKIYRCDYCGKLYTDELEMIDLKRIEDLRKDSKNGLATLYLDEMLNAEPGNYLCLWEKLNCSLTPNMVSEHLMKTHGDMTKLMSFQKSAAYVRFSEALPEDKKKYTDDISKYISVARRSGNIQRSDITPREVRRSYGMSASEKQDLSTKNNTIRVAAILAAIAIGCICRSSLVLVICLAVAVVSLILYERHQAKAYSAYYEDINEKAAPRAENDLQVHEETVKELSDLRSEMRSLLGEIRKSEEEMLDLISR